MKTANPKSRLRGILWTATLSAWIVLCGHKWGPLPPLGKFLSPFAGFWRNAEIRLPGSQSVALPDLAGTVSLEYDKRGVPHVFASNLKGLFFAQGYATARDRLWQMDVQSRAGLGRLSEVMGKDLLRFDLERRRMGLAASATTSLHVLEKDSLSRLTLDAYAAGVNAWIESLSPSEYPLEFKLLDYAPEPWTPLKSVALLKNMQWTLSKGNDDYPLTQSLRKFGAKIFSELYPLRHPGTEPIQPQGSPPSPFAKPYHDTLFARPQPGAGSNNFVLAGNHTQSGHPILGNDPHLDLTMPSIWYEIQLQGGAVNAYGVSIPGLPGVVIGFNNHVAWGLTNGMDDVYDWYPVTFKDSTLREYAWNGRWNASRFRIDTILVRGRPAWIDTQLWTHLGPVPVRKGEKPFDGNTPALHTLRWLALDSSDDITPFLRLLTVTNYVEFRAAIRGLRCPSQNFVFADSGDIAWVHQGLFPVKRPGQGRTVVPGSDSTWEWRGFVPDSLLPSSRNPSRGWLASANQEPTDSAYPFYLGSGFFPPERSQRQTEIFSAVAPHSATLADAWNIVLDDYSVHAEKTLPLLLRAILSKIDAASLSPDARQGLRLLQAWDFRYRPESAAAWLFDRWWKNFYRRTWEDDFAGDSLQYAWPSRDVTRALLEKNPSSPWFDDVRTPVRETAADLALAAWNETVAQARVAAGNLDSVAWGRLRPISIPHLLRLQPFGVYGLVGGGCAECLDAQRGSHGPSWRMVVEPGAKPKALGIYPGGQTGNPGSPAYEAFVTDWLAGRSYSLLFMQHANEAHDSIAYRLTLKGTL